MIDLTFSISNNMINEAKGKVVLSIIDDSFATTKYLEIRQKSDSLVAYYSFSVAGFGEFEKGKAKVLNDSTIRFHLNSRDYSEKLIYDFENKTFINDSLKIRYRILSNKLIKN